MLLSDRDIRALLSLGDLRIEPLREDTIRENGVDLRLSRQFCRLRHRDDVVLDPDDPGDPREYYDCVEAESIVVHPGERLLAVTEETVALPGYLAGLVTLRSTWARTGLWVPPTVVDAGFHGQIVVEIMGSSFPVKLKAGTRFLHLVLIRLATPVENPYSGDYQGQRGVTLPKFFLRRHGEHPRNEHTNDNDVNLSERIETLERKLAWLERGVHSLTVTLDLLQRDISMIRKRGVAHGSRDKS